MLATWSDVSHMMDRSYVVKAREIPLYALLRCGPGAGDLILRPVTPGAIGSMLACPGTPR
ncbi:MAG: hypothetical protein WBW84_01470 [Acidobacteriaceae bacterium]